MNKIPEHYLIPLLHEINVGESVFVNPYSMSIDQDGQGWLPKNENIVLPEVMGEGSYLRIRRINLGFAAMIEEMPGKHKWVRHRFRSVHGGSEWEVSIEELMAGENFMEEDYIPVVAYNTQQMIEMEIEYFEQIGEYRKAGHYKSELENILELKKGGFTSALKPIKRPLGTEKGKSAQ